MEQTDALFVLYVSKRAVKMVLILTTAKKLGILYLSFAKMAFLPSYGMKSSRRIQSLADFYLDDLLKI